jgi:hypothetical protein
MASEAVRFLENSIEVGTQKYGGGGTAKSDEWEEAKVASAFIDGERRAGA